MWLQGLFLFALIWGLGGTLNLDSRKKFDTFLRELINGMDEYPKPKNVKLSKVYIYLKLNVLFIN
jgi:dynein heavy chain